MKDQRYLELEILKSKSGQTETRPSKRGHVMINAEQADMLNIDSKKTGLIYELDEENPTNEGAKPKEPTKKRTVKPKETK